MSDDCDNQQVTDEPIRKKPRISLPPGSIDVSLNGTQKSDETSNKGQSESASSSQHKQRNLVQTPPQIDFFNLTTQLLQLPEEQLLKTVLEEGPIFVYVITPQGSVDVGVILSNFSEPHNEFPTNAHVIRMDSSDEIKLSLRDPGFYNASLVAGFYSASVAAETLNLQPATLLPITTSQQPGSVLNATRLEPNCEEKQGLFPTLSSTNGGQPITLQSLKAGPLPRTSCGYVPSSSCFSNTERNPMQRRYQIENHLRLLLHARKCLESQIQQMFCSFAYQTSCDLPGCPEFKKLLRHAMDCLDKNSCTVAHCSSSRQIIAHWRNCIRTSCDICSPLKQDQQNSTNDDSKSSPDSAKQNNNDIIRAYEALGLNPPPSLSTDCLGSESSTAEPNIGKDSAPTDGHVDVTPDQRQHLIQKISQAFYLTFKEPLPLDGSRWYLLTVLAHKIEKQTFIKANSKEVYHNELAKKICIIQKDLEISWLSRIFEKDCQSCQSKQCASSSNQVESSVSEPGVGSSEIWINCPSHSHTTDVATNQQTIFQAARGEITARATVSSRENFGKDGHRSYDLLKDIRHSHAHFLLDALKGQHENGHFLDFMLEVDGVILRVHGSIFSALSPYFEACFRRHTSNSGVIVLPPQIKEKSIRTIIDYAYSGKLKTSFPELEDLLIAADFLMMDTVFVECRLYMFGLLAVDNCLNILQVATQFNMTDFRGAVMKYIREHFEQVMSLDEIWNVDRKLMIEILSSDDLVVTEDGFLATPSRQEENLFFFISKYNSSRRNLEATSKFKLWTKAMRLPLMSKSFLLLLKSRYPVSQNVLNLIDWALDVQASKEITKWIRSHSLKSLKYSCWALEHQSYRSDSVRAVFNDSSLKPKHGLLYVIGMKLYARRFIGNPAIGGIRVLYSTVASVLHGSDNYGHEVYEFRLKPNERITSVLVEAGQLINCLTFTTSKGRQLGKYGESVSVAVTEDGRRGYLTMEHAKPPVKTGGFLASIGGRVDTVDGIQSVRRLHLFWGFSDLEEVEEEFDDWDNPDQPDDYQPTSGVRELDNTNFISSDWD